MRCWLTRALVNRLGSGNLRLAVILPEGEDLNEWLAVNSELLAHHQRWQEGSATAEPASAPPCEAVDFFNQINMLVR